MAGVASREVPPDGRILMLYDARGRPFDRPVMQDDLAVAWPLLKASGHADDCLAGLGFTHVHVNFGALAFYSARAEAPPEVADRSLARFVDRASRRWRRSAGWCLPARAATTRRRRGGPCVSRAWPAR